MFRHLHKSVVKVFWCVLVLLVTGYGQNALAAECWNDADLSALEKSQANGVIYVWSPRMALSVLHAGEVARQARMAGLIFIPVVDERVPEGEWRSALGATVASHASNPGFHDLVQSQSLCAGRLIALDAYQHFPSVFLVHSGQLQNGKWTGAMNAATWASAFQTADLHQTPLTFETPGFIKQNVFAAAVISPPPTSVISLNEERKVPNGEGCVAVNQFVSLPPELAGRGDDQAVALGAYERISPDGRFILRSYSGKYLSTVSLIELPGPSPETNKSDATVSAITQTPLSNEAFPVQGSWRYIVNTNGQHFAFKDLLVRQTAATPHFQGGMSGFYAAAAEVASTYPEKTSSSIQIRSLSWPNPTADSDMAGEGMLTSRTITVDTVQNRVLADSGRANLCLSRIGIDGSLYSLPMISVDGQSFAALPQRPVQNVSTMQVFGFGADGRQCSPKQQFTSPSGKVTFGFTPDAQQNPASKLADLVYEYRGQAWWYDSQAAKSFNLAPWQERPADGTTPYRQKIVASAFPGLTRDGRVIYAATWQACTGTLCTEEAGYVVSDPYQSNAFKQYLSMLDSTSLATKKTQGCIKISDALLERADFAKFHDIFLR